MKTESGGKKSEISRRVIEQSREQAARPIKARIRIQSQFAGRSFHVFQDWNHRSENAEEEPADFLERRESKIVGVANACRCCAVGSERGQNHQRFAPTCRRDGECAQKNDEEEKVTSAVATPFRQIAFGVSPRRAKAEAIENEKGSQNQSHREQPRAP